MRKYIQSAELRNMLLIEIILISFFCFVFNSSLNLNESNYELNYYFTTKENYKFLDKENEYLDIKYKGLNEYEIFNKYSRLDTDKLLIDNYIAVINNKISFKDLSNKQQYVLDNLKDQTLKKALKVSFTGVDILLYDSIYYNYYSDQNKSLFLSALMNIICFFMVFLLVFIFMKIVEIKQIK